MCVGVLRTGPMKWPQRWVAAYAVTLPAGKGVLVFHLAAAVVRTH